MRQLGLCALSGNRINPNINCAASFACTSPSPSHLRSLFLSDPPRPLRWTIRLAQLLSSYFPSPKYRYEEISASQPKCYSEVRVGHINLTT